jgi:hypothetical protein
MNDRLSCRRGFSSRAEPRAATRCPVSRVERRAGLGAAPGRALGRSGGAADVAVLAGGDQASAADQATADTPGPGGQARKTSARDHTTHATGHLSRWWRGGALAGGDRARVAAQAAPDVPAPDRPTRETRTTPHATSHGGALVGGDQRGAADQTPAGAPVRGGPTREARTTLHATSFGGAPVGGIKRARLVRRRRVHQVRDARRARLGQHPMQRLTVMPWRTGIEPTRLIRRRPVHEVRGARRARLGQHPMQRPTVVP